MAVIPVAVVEDEPSELASLQKTVNGNGLHCVGAVSTAETALKQFPSLKPDAIVVDLGLPRMTGIRCIWELKKRLPKTEFLVHTIDVRPRHVFQALQAGATGYLIKGASSKQIRDALQDMVRGGSPMSPSIARLIVKRFQSSLKHAGFVA